ncbi:alpha/beta fold hydrolase [Streptomyces lasalocidi]
MPFASPDERYVTRDGVDLAVHDHGGDGPPLLLLHGAGRTLADWAAVAPLLTPRHRVIAMDLRAHGRSGSGAWTFPAVLADVAAVLDALDVPRAVPVGHSLGGMVAVRYALDHPETPGAVNLDGHGYGRPEQYVGLDPEYVGRRLEEIRGFAARAAGRILPASDMAAVLGGQRAMAEGLGIARDLFDEGLRRSLAERADGMRWLRPEREPAAPDAGGHGRARPVPPLPTRAQPPADLPSGTPQPAHTRPAVVRRTHVRLRRGAAPGSARAGTDAALCHGRGHRRDARDAPRTARRRRGTDPLVHRPHHTFPLTSAS